MSNMENAHSEDMQFDDIDLISASLAQQVPPQKPVQTVAEFLQSVIVKDSLPKEDLRRSWNILLDFIFESNNRKLHCY